MGNASYSTSDRLTRATAQNYHNVTTDNKVFNNVFTQQSVGHGHHLMSPLNVIRESRYSDLHPNVIPVQLYLDVTGSMMDIPKVMLAEGLPHIMSTLLEKTNIDIALMFGAIGDHEYDRYPLQVGQFESGDAELDNWLTKTYLEGNGGGNAGESYLLAWLFSHFCTLSDAWLKNKVKGKVITIGDEPCLRTISKNRLVEIIGNISMQSDTITMEEAYKLASEKNDVYHIFIEHGSRRLNPEWKELLGNNLFVTSDIKEIANIIAVNILSKPATIVEENKPSNDDTFIRR
jgi:hypothetical protein